VNKKRLRNQIGGQGPVKAVELLMNKLLLLLLLLLVVVVVVVAVYYSAAHVCVYSSLYFPYLLG
jgi:hypothetical protein